MLSNPGPEPKLRTMDFNWRAAPENPGSPVRRGVPPPKCFDRGGPVTAFAVRDDRAAPRNAGLPCRVGVLRELERLLREPGSRGRIVHSPQRVELLLLGRRGRPAGLGVLGVVPGARAACGIALAV